MSKELHQAILGEDTSHAISLLVENKDIQKNVNQTFYHNKYSTKVTTLYLACDNSNISVVEILLDIPGIDVNFEAERRADTPLHAAASVGSVDIVNLLLKAKSHIATNMLGSTPVQRSAVNGHHEVMAMLLRHDKMLIDAKTLSDTPLHWACKHGHLQCVEVLVTYGANISLRNANNKRPIDIATEKKHADIVAFLKKDDEDQDINSDLPQDNASEPESHDEFYDEGVNLRSFADFGAHQVHFNDKQCALNEDQTKRIHELECGQDEQQSVNKMFSDDIEVIKAEYQDLRSKSIERDFQYHQLSGGHQKQGAFNTELKERVTTLETTHNTHKENTIQEMAALKKRLERLETKIPTQSQPNQKAKQLCSIARENFVKLKENLMACDHIDYLYAKEALSLADIQMIQSKPYGEAQTQEMLYKLMAKKDHRWIYTFLNSLDSHPTTKHLVEIFK